MSEKGPADNPNLCYSCSSIADEMEELGAQPQETLGQTVQLRAEALEDLRRAA
jgi:hypothetical protein